MLAIANHLSDIPQGKTLMSTTNHLFALLCLRQYCSDEGAGETRLRLMADSHQRFVQMQGWYLQFRFTLTCLLFEVVRFQVCQVGSHASFVSQRWTTYILLCRSLSNCARTELRVKVLKLMYKRFVKKRNRKSSHQSRPREVTFEDISSSLTRGSSSSDTSLNIFIVAVLFLFYASIRLYLNGEYDVKCNHL